MTPFRKALLSILGLVVVVALFLVWLDFHDKDIAKHAQQQMEINSLHQQTAQLVGELHALETKDQEIQKLTAAKVQAEDDKRAQADTPDKQVTFISTEEPKLHPKLEIQDEQPVVVFPQAETAVISDVLHDRSTANIKLAGAEERLTTCQAEVANLTKQKANGDAEISLLKSDKNSTSRKWFGRGMTVGGVVAGILIKFVL